MTSRLIVFILFLTAAVSLLSISGYKKYFEKDHSLNLAQIRAERAKLEEERLALIAAQKAAEEAKNNPGVIVLSKSALRGKEIYNGETHQCLRCHGENGQGNESEEAPLIAGQHDWYVIDQLKQMQAGSRVNEKMMPFLKGLSEENIKDLAAYIETLRIPE